MRCPHVAVLHTHAAPHQGWGGPRGIRVATLAMAILLVWSASPAIEHAHGFTFVPLINTFATPDTSGSKSQSSLLCREGGGYLAGEPTESMHLAVIQAARAAGAGPKWYAYLAASTDGNSQLNCPPSLQQMRFFEGGLSYGCYWRWNQGRWKDMKDNSSLPYYAANVGVTFYVGNYFTAPVTPAVQIFGSQGEFPAWFNHTRGGDDSMNRPGAQYGQHLLAVGAGDTSTWSDNLDKGGYVYAGYAFNQFFNLSQWNTSAQEASKANFYAVCQTQAASRAIYEMQDTSSSFQQNWWLLYGTFLCLGCFVVLVMTACCQDSEDMDEPPEEAPEWAEDEARHVKRTQSFQSSRSFGQPAEMGSFRGDSATESSCAVCSVGRKPSLHRRRSRREDEREGDEVVLLLPSQGADDKPSSAAVEPSGLKNNWV